MPADKEPSGAAKMFGDFAPALVGFTDDVLFGQVWEREELSPRDRSLVTVACLVTSGNTDQLAFHLGYAKRNGVTEQELIGAITVEPASGARLRKPHPPYLFEVHPAPARQPVCRARTGHSGRDVPCFGHCSAFCKGLLDGVDGRLAMAQRIEQPDADVGSVFVQQPVPALNVTVIGDHDVDVDLHAMRCYRRNRGTERG